MSKITEEKVASDLLWGLWRSIENDYKDRYKMEIWEHFENAIRSASYVGSLKAFLEKITKRIPMNLQVQYMKEIRAVVDSGEDDTVLDWLRTETTYLVMLTRLDNQSRKELYELETENKKEA